MREFTAKGFAEGVKLILAGIAVAATNSTPIGIIVGAGAKGIVDKLLAKSSEIEKKIDMLLREPFITGIKHLHDGISMQSTSEEHSKAKDDLLFQAHLSLTKAWAMTSDSLEDSMFILALDNVALAAHRSYNELCEKSIKRLEFYLEDYSIKVQSLVLEARKQQEYTEGVHRFLFTDPLRDKPIGYGNQKMIYRSLKKSTDKLNLKAEHNEEKLDLLKNLHKLSLLLLSNYDRKAQ